MCSLFWSRGRSAHAALPGCDTVLYRRSVVLDCARWLQRARGGGANMRLVFAFLGLAMAGASLSCVATTQYVVPLDGDAPTWEPAPSVRVAACANCALGTTSSRVPVGFAPLLELDGIRVEIFTPYRCSLAGSTWGSCSVRITVPASHLVELRFLNVGDEARALERGPILLVVDGRPSRLPVDVGRGSLDPGESLVVSYDFGPWDELGRSYALDLSGPLGTEVEPVVLRRYRTRTFGLFARP